MLFVMPMVNFQTDSAETITNNKTANTKNVER